jgi:phage-related protein
VLGDLLDVKILFDHRWQIASPAEADGQSQVEIFVDGLAASFSSSAEGLLIMLERHSRQGPDAFNTAQVHYVDQKEKIYEYIKGRLRLFWFEDGDRVVICTHGIIKKTQKTPKREIDRAIRVKRAYEDSKARNLLKLLKEE